VDVGSNTVRLLVAALGDGKLLPLREERDHLLLGEDVERLGRLRPAKLAEAADCTARYVGIARRAGASVLEVLVTAPGRQSANAEELVCALSAAGGAPVRVLTPEEEGELAFAGAVAAARRPPETVAVCDVGGGSTEVVVGTPSGGPAWRRSFDLGCVRLTRRALAHDPPTRRALLVAREQVERRLERFAPPLPLAAYAPGGTARALRRLVGRTLGAEELDAALAILARRPAAKVAKTFDIHPRRAATLPAGAILLAGVQARLSVPLQVSRAGLREGAALALLAEAAAACEACATEHALVASSRLLHGLATHAPAARGHRVE
jgi:exopolyphosphatase/guanosine-5'-triphosphate,3'-diphosphate pyrophosphatase